MSMATFFGGVPAGDVVFSLCESWLKEKEASLWSIAMLMTGR